MQNLALAGAKREKLATEKGEQTRTLILETALSMFYERGYEETTMRAIAREAGVSLGNAYYYFASKENLIQAIYAKSHVEHLAACRPLLDTTPELKARLKGVMRAKVETLAPYHRFAGVLFRTAADPSSPLNPFSEASGPVRREAVALFAEVLHGSSTKAPKSLAGELPELLWLYHMGIILFWVHDRSPGCERSFHLAERTAEIVHRLIVLAKLPPLRPMVRSLLALLAELRPR